ncbi:hypothetical protein MJO47_10075 [Desulfuromonas sp. KJ2020]|uniref:hypothetical protein n=1 Tax=Desulfuromonas sp. KJ2020 TaxID=2919173 RepID=UPI0020A709FF|nr:hypothetical protein [Desulfuromonas sp. KJ2020]MCP3177446.1 hypothetical protein [Desulfuromonas sp. KJ2020]
MSQSWAEVRDELHRRRDILVHRSYDTSFQMEPSERERIQLDLERWKSPPRCTDIPNLMKQFCVSAYSYAPIRNNLLSPLAEGLPTRQNIALALSRVFDDQQEFLDDAFWSPDLLGDLAAEIQERYKFNQSSRQFRPRILAVLLTGSRKLEEALRDGLDGFYEMVGHAKTPSAMWSLVNNFSKGIDYVGPALVCDFFKEIGFVQYVKVDHHFAAQFPELIKWKGGCRLSPRQSFILSQEIADAVGMTPFHLDAILYLWGRYGDRS